MDRDSVVAGFAEVSNRHTKRYAKGPCNGAGQSDVFAMRMGASGRLPVSLTRFAGMRHRVFVKGSRPRPAL
jgi:hypothetical protein